LIERLEIMAKPSQIKTPQDVEAYRLLQNGLALAKSNRHDLAADLFRKAVKMAMSADVKKAAAYNAAVALSIMAISEASKYGSARPPKNVEAEVEGLFQEALWYAPDCTLALDQYGYLKILQGNLEEAAELYRKVADLQPMNYEAQRKCAFSYASCHLYEKALYYANRAFSINNEDADLIGVVSKLLHETGDYVQSIEYAKLALKRNPDLAIAHECAALSYGMLDKWTKSTGHLKIAHKLNPKDERLTGLYYVSWMEATGHTRNFRVTQEWLDARRWLFQHKIRSNDIEDQKLAKRYLEKFSNIFSKFECQRCGRCCRDTKWAHSIDSHIMWEDIQRWRREKENNILRLIHVYEGLGGDIIDKARGKLYTKCPFFRYDVSGQAECTIHNTKPFNCRIAPLYFNPEGVCPYCEEVIPKEADSCPNCGQFIRIDPGFVTRECPGVTQMKKLSAKELRRMRIKIRTGPSLDYLWHRARMKWFRL